LVCRDVEVVKDGGWNRDVCDANWNDKNKRGVLRIVIRVPFSGYADSNDFQVGHVVFDPLTPFYDESKPRRQVSHVIEDNSGSLLYEQVSVNVGDVVWVEVEAVTSGMELGFENRAGYACAIENDRWNFPETLQVLEERRFIYLEGWKCLWFVIEWKAKEVGKRGRWFRE
jgi:hypothetical protein